MGIGPNIKKYRAQLALTQKDLADKLNVTYQAVSRWENDDVEPSIDTLKEMASLFNCSLDELLGSKVKEEIKEEPIQPEVVEKIVIQEAKPVLAICENCNKPLYYPEEIKRINLRHKHGRSWTSSTKILCEKCNKQRLEEERQEAERAVCEEKRDFRKWRILGYVFGGIAALIFAIVGIKSYIEGDNDTGLGCIIACVMSFTFISCMFMHNNCVFSMFLKISSWSVKFPGVLFSLDINGIIFLIAVKLLFAILGVLISIAAVIFALLLSSAVSVIIYPFALYHSYKCIDNSDI